MARNMVLLWMKCMRESHEICALIVLRHITRSWMILFIIHYLSTFYILKVQCCLDCLETFIVVFVQIVYSEIICIFAKITLVSTYDEKKYVLIRYFRS
jgi:hypothetical protein